MPNAQNTKNHKHLNEKWIKYLLGQISQLPKCDLGKWAKGHMTYAHGEDEWHITLTGGDCKGMLVIGGKRWIRGKFSPRVHPPLAGKRWLQLGHDLIVELMIHVLEQGVHENSKNLPGPHTCNLHITIQLFGRMCTGCRVSPMFFMKIIIHTESKSNLICML